MVRPTLVVHKSNVPLLFGTWLSIVSYYERSNNNKHFETTLTKMSFTVGYRELLRFQITSGEFLR